MKESRFTGLSFRIALTSTVAVLGIAVLVFVGLNMAQPLPMVPLAPSLSRIVIIVAGFLSAASIGGVIIGVRRFLAGVDSIGILLAKTQISQIEVSTELSTLANSKGELARLGKSLVALANGINERIFWYESILDSIPFPISVTDMDMKWTFVNKPVEQLLKVKRAEVLGKTCNHWNANICNTENCGIYCLRHNQPRTFFDQNGGSYQVDSTYILNTAGERVGHIETVQEITRLVASMRYQDREVEKLAACLEKMASGDLSFEVLPPAASDQNTEEVRKLFVKVNNSLDQARARLAQALIDVVNDSTEVSSASQQLAATSTQTSSAVNQIAITIQQMARGTAQQTEGISRTASVIDAVNRTVDGVAKGSYDQASAVEKVLAVTQKIVGENGIASRVNLSTAKVQEMGTRSEQIGAIIETIEDIASQTNLLALNAAIEAARAGEMGKGFAVVADEVRKLAERSSSSTREIGSLIKEIQASITGAVSMATQASQEINQASQELTTAISSVSQVVERNSQATRDLLKNTEEVDQAIANIASVSEENSAATEEVSASTEEMNAQVEEVTASAQSLEEMAHNLQKVLSQFKLTRGQETGIGGGARTLVR